MVQPVATSSCYSSLPYQLVSGACSAIRSLVEKIANFVISIFTTIAQRVRARLCGETTVTPPAGASPTTGTNAASDSPDLLTGPRNEEAKVFLHVLLQHHQAKRCTFDKGHIEKILGNPAAAQSFFAHFLVFDFVIDSELSSRGALPFLVTQQMGPNPQTFIAKIEELYNNFDQLEYDLQNEIRARFISTHLLQSNAPSQNNEEITFYLADTFETEDLARTFYADAENLAKMFIQHNTTFTAAVETVRIEEESKHFLKNLLNSYTHRYKAEQIREIMEDEAAAKPFFAHLLIRNLGMEVSSKGQLPYMLTKAMDPTFIPDTAMLHFKFCRFDYDLQSIILLAFEKKHLGYIPDEDEESDFTLEDDELKEAEYFQKDAETLAAKLLQNSTFSTAVNAARIEYLKKEYIMDIVRTRYLKEEDIP